MELKKSYMGFVLWLLGYTAAMLSLSFLSVEDGWLAARLLCMLTVLAMAALMWIIYRTEYVYWFNGTEYEEAVAAGSVRRKAFARRHLMRFAAFAAAYLLLSLVLQLLGCPGWVDLIVVGLGLVAVAISTNQIKL